jgi:flagellar motor switch/type III secretory pathway protein FliN
LIDFGSKSESEIILKDELCDQYSWFNNTFLPVINEASQDFFTNLFSFKLVSLSKNVNVLFQGDEYFVTKVRIDKQHDVFFRYSSDSIKLILDKTLGENKKFNLANMTELEAKIISSFNDYLYNNISKSLLAPPVGSKKRKNFDMIHLTIFIKDTSGNGAKLIISLPCVLLAPQSLAIKEAKIDISNFKRSKIDVKIKIGTIKFPLREIKNLEKDDIVVFEENDIRTMELVYKDYRKKFKVTPNPGIITSINNGGNNMDGNTSQNLWDNIQVELGAEFDKVKITLGELKSIEEGSVVEISAVYDNKISLKVEEKTIAKGELVIINDRYAVKIDEVFASEKNQAETGQPAEEIKHEGEAEVLPEGEETASDEEFDYSDFELDDQDI